MALQRGLSLLTPLPHNHDINHLRGALRLIDRRDQCIEGGAHRGIWTEILSREFGEVFAFEPVHDTQEFENVQNFKCALGDEPGTYIMSPGKDNDGQWHFSASDFTGVSANVVRIDDFDLSPDFIKLDVEGYELFALKGGERTVMKSKPFIMVELNGLSQRYGHTDGDVRSWLEDRGYKEIGRWNKDYLFAS